MHYQLFRSYINHHGEPILFLRSIKIEYKQLTRGGKRCVRDRILLAYHHGPMTVGNGTVPRERAGPSHGLFLNAPPC